METCKISKKYLADALSYLGFRYFKNGHGADVFYSFERTAKFDQALTQLKELKEKLNMYEK